jgi:hypothetical protein
MSRNSSCFLVRFSSKEKVFTATLLSCFEETYVLSIEVCNQVVILNLHVGEDMDEFGTWWTMVITDDLSLFPSFILAAI